MLGFVKDFGTGKDRCGVSFRAQAEQDQIESGQSVSCNLDQLPAKGFLVIALPMKIKGGSGGPLRIVAIL